MLSSSELKCGCDDGAPEPHARTPQCPAWCDAPWTRTCPQCGTLIQKAQPWERWECPKCGWNGA